MRASILRIAMICGAATILSLSCAPSFAKTVKECDAEYTANKAAIKASGQTKADYVAACRTGSAAPATAPAAAAPAAAAPPPAATASGAVKTVKECDAEYSANKAAIKAAGQKKADFVAACRAGAAAPVAAPAAAPAAPAPAAAPAAAPSRPPVAAAKPRVAAPTGAGDFAADSQAKAHCPSDTVVWVNTKSGVYHFAGTRNYGTTKQGTYMCEADAKAAGDRAAENEKHP
jgi:hypothetical protein